MGAKPSMSRTGCCYDNAPMGSFFRSLKVELVHQHCWTTREEARRDLFVDIESYYNRQRIHSALGYLTRTGRAENVLTWCPRNRGKISLCSIESVDSQICNDAPYSHGLPP
jgi:transposase InsO family protein